MTNYYELLQLQPAASTAEIQSAYHRQRASLLAADVEDLPQQLTMLDEAYAVLSEPGQRAAYDRSLSDEPSSRSLVLADQPAGILAPRPSSVPVVQRECWKCGKPNPIQATMCAFCGTQISRPCPQCGQIVALDQTVCPRCNTLLPEYDARRFAETVQIERTIQEERRFNEARVQTLEETHTANRISGTFFWVVVVFLCITLTFLSVFFLDVFERVFQ